MTHELRTPLQAILGFSEVLELHQGLNSEQQEFITGIQQGGQHMLGLVNQLLDLAKIESGNMEVFLETIAAKNFMLD